MESDKILLQIEGVPITCSKEDLSKESAYFKAMFQGDFVEKDRETIELKGVKIKGFLAVLEVHKNNGNITNYTKDLNELILIFTTANMLQFHAIQELCVQPVLDLMSPENVLIVWQFAEKFELKDLKVKARYLAVTEFEKIRKTDSFLALESEWLFRYLANRNLLCHHEANVFDAGMLWITSNCGESENIIYSLLCCMDFNALSSVNVVELQSHFSLNTFKNLVDILQCVVDIRNKQSLSGHTAAVTAKAEFLLKSKPRVRAEYPAFTINSISDEQNATLCALGMEPQRVRDGLAFCYDGDNYKVVGDRKIPYHKVPGQSIFGYKHYIFVFGGEFTIGRGAWMEKILVYDTIKDKWEVKSKMPFRRRHFNTVVCGKYVYVIGGFGKWRKRINDMYWYDCEKDEWSKSILLPKCRSTEIKFCQVNKQLFITDLCAENPMVYSFIHEDSQWKEVIVCPNSKIPVEGWNIVVFCYNNSIFVKGKHLTEFKLTDNQLILIKTETLQSSREDKMATGSYVSGDTLYVLYSGWSAFERAVEHATCVQYEDKRSVESFSLVTHTSTIMDINSDQVFGLQHYDICESENFVNVL